jgi:hypothetical protein
MDEQKTCDEAFNDYNKMHREALEAWQPFYDRLKELANENNGKLPDFGRYDNCRAVFNINKKKYYLVRDSYGDLYICSKILFKKSKIIEFCATEHGRKDLVKVDLNDQYKDYIAILAAINADLDNQMERILKEKTKRYKELAQKEREKKLCLV